MRHGFSGADASFTSNGKLGPTRFRQMAAFKQGKQEDKKETKWDGHDPWVAQFDEWSVQTHNAARIVRNASCGGLRNRSLGFQLLSDIAILSVGDSLRESSFFLVFLT
ncbi:hypothetical protein [Cupriavidus necator]